MSDQVDWTDSHGLARFSAASVRLSEDYLAYRKVYARTKVELHRLIALSYKESKINTKMALDKAILLLTIDNPEAEKLYNDLITSEETVKGLEEVIKARKSHTNLAITLRQNRAQEGA